MCSTGRLSMMAVMSTSTESFQIPIEAAEAYEDAFVPLVLRTAGFPLLCEAVVLTAGQRVLDVACGTGIVARTAADIVGPENVLGLDLNEAMLTVAKRVNPDISWRQGDVAALPLPDVSFDAVLCQMALMFFPDRPAALREMARVTRLGGTVGVLVPSSLDSQPAYKPFVEMAARHAGPEARSLLSTYFACGDTRDLLDLFDQAGLTSTVITPHAGFSKFPSIDAAVATEVESTPLGERMTEDVYERIRREANEMFARFVTDEGGIEFPFESLVVVGHRERRQESPPPLAPLAPPPHRGRTVFRPPRREGPVRSSGLGGWRTPNGAQSPPPLAPLAPPVTGGGRNIKSARRPLSGASTAPGGRVSSPATPKSARGQPGRSPCRTRRGGA